MKCKGCAHWRPLSSQTKSSIMVCHYCLDMGVPRMVPSEQCYTEKVHYKQMLPYKPIPFRGSRMEQYGVYTKANGG